MKQVDVVLKHLNKNTHLTPLEAMGVYGIHRLPARVHELKQMGYDIRSHTHVDGMGRHYASYTLHG